MRKGNTPMTNPQQPVPPIVAGADDVFIDPSLMDVSDEEADEEIDIPGLDDDVPADHAAEATVGDTTPSVRSAVNRAADILRDLRAQ
jgi:tRNA A-37 threonylcarbamoyl transferase component Bud32